MSCGADSNKLSEMDVSEALDLMEDTKYLFCGWVVSIFQRPIKSLKLLDWYMSYKNTKNKYAHSYYLSDWKTGKCRRCSHPVVKNLSQMLLMFFLIFVIDVRFGLDNFHKFFQNSTLLVFIKNFFKKLIAIDIKKGTNSTETVSDPHLWSPFKKCS